MGAMAISTSRFDVIGAKRSVYGVMSFSASYATGGDTFTAAMLGLSNVEAMIVGAYQNPYLVSVNVSGGVIQAFSAINTEVGNGTNLNTTGFEFVAIGT